MWAKIRRGGTVRRPRSPFRYCRVNNKISIIPDDLHITSHRPCIKRLLWILDLSSNQQLPKLSHQNSMYNVPSPDTENVQGVMYNNIVYNINNCVDITGHIYNTYIIHVVLYNLKIVFSKVYFLLLKAY